MESNEGYYPERSKLSADKLAEFIRSPTIGDITCIPSLGPATKELLKSIKISASDGELRYEIGKIETTYQLYGLFLMMKGEDVGSIEHADRFYHFLVNIGITRRLIPDIVKSICNKMAISFPDLYDESEYRSLQDEHK